MANKKHSINSSKLSNVHEASKLKLNASFNNLILLLEKYDPIKLLSQIQLTHLIVPENEYYGEDSDQESWLRKTEFIAGFYLSRKFSENTKSVVDGSDLSLVERAIETYFQSVNMYLITYKTEVEAEKLNENESVLHDAKLFSLHVRGESYQHQLKDIFLDMYSAHDEWFKKNLGFTIQNATEISESIIGEYNSRINLEKFSSLRRARRSIRKLNNEGINFDDPDLELTRLGCKYFFGESDRILSFTLRQLVKFSGYPTDICKSYLDRLSQRFGYHSHKFPHTFEKAELSPWDYNTLYERPIIAYGRQYYVPIPSIFYEVLYRSFYYDLINDTLYWKHDGQKKHGISLELKTAEYLKRIFPKDCVLLNPRYPTGEEMCDVLVLYDRHALVFQDKAKRMRLESLTGKDFTKLRNDLNEGIRKAYDQAIVAKQYLESNSTVTIAVADGNVVVDARQISKIYPISITLDTFQNFATRFENTNSILHLFDKDKYPWSVSVSNLGTITEVIEKPFQLLHYLRQRVTTEQTPFDLYADELDMLGLYFSQGIVFDDKKLQRTSAASFSGFSNSIDKYMFEKHETSLEAHRPSQESPAGFDAYLQAIDGLKTAYRTDCILRLLDLSYRGRQEFVETAEVLKKRIMKGKMLESFSFTIPEYSLGFCFIGMGGEVDSQNLYRQLFSFAVMKKYMTKSKEWVTLGWKNSDKLVDMAIFMSYDWVEDNALQSLSEKSLKKGKKVGIHETLGE